MTLSEHEKKLIEDDQYRRDWMNDEIRKSSAWFSDQLKDHEYVECHNNESVGCKMSCSKRKWK